MSYNTLNRLNHSNSQKSKTEILENYELKRLQKEKEEYEEAIRTLEKEKQTPKIKNAINDLEERVADITAKLNEFFPVENEDFSKDINEINVKMKYKD